MLCVGGFEVVWCGHSCGQICVWWYGWGAVEGFGPLLCGVGGFEVVGHSCGQICVWWYGWGAVEGFGPLLCVYCLVGERDPDHPVGGRQNRRAV